MPAASRFSALALLAAMILALAACAPTMRTPGVDPALAAQEAAVQRGLAVQMEAEALPRLRKVAFKVLTAGAPVCKEHGAAGVTLGLSTLDAAMLPDPAWRASYTEFYHLDTFRPTVMGVMPGGPAESAGARQGDVIEAVNGKPFSESDKNLATANEFLDEAAKAGPVQLRLLRSGQALDVVVKPVETCAFKARVIPGDVVNAYADGKWVHVTQGMMNFCKSDDDLAVIIGHELAHNALGHIQKQRANRALGGLFDILVAGTTGVNTGGMGSGMGGMAFSQEFEAEADYVGLYFAARAGYSIKDAAMVWRRMAASNPAAIAKGASHPSTSSRYVAIEAARAEIERKEASGLELEPEAKKAP